MKLRALLIAGFVLAAAGPAAAQPRLHLSWQGCNGPPGLEAYAATDHVLTVSMDGVGGTLGGVDVKLGIINPCSSDGQDIPQVWQYYPGGCREGLLTVSRPASLDGCPGILPGAGGVIADQVDSATVWYYIGGYESFLIPVVFVHVRTGFQPRTFDAGTRYVIAQIHFPMDGTLAGKDPNGALCGCGSSPRRIEAFAANVDGPDATNLLAYEQVDWVDWVYCAIAKTPPTRLAGEGDPPSCLFTPASKPSWGSVKALYR